MCDYIELRFEGSAIKSVFKEPFTIERLLSKAASLLIIPEEQVLLQYRAVYVNQ